MTISRNISKITPRYIVIKLFKIHGKGNVLKVSLGERKDALYTEEIEIRWQQFSGQKPCMWEDIGAISFM